MQESRIDNFTRVFFWFGYVVFLLASIPHIATYFRHFDGNISDDKINIAAWVIAYLIAIVIDTSDVLVSIAVMKAMANGARHRDVVPYWLFIFFIMLFSWFVNWQYNKVFENAAFSVVDNMHVFGVVRVGSLNPLLGSSFQVLLLIYTGMAHKFHKKETLDEMKTRLKKLQDQEETFQQLRAIEARMQGKKEEGDLVVGAFQLFGKVAKEAQKLKAEISQNPQQISGESDQESDQEMVSQNGPQMTPLAAENHGQRITQKSEEEDAQIEQDKLAKTLEIMRQNPSISDDFLAQELKLIRPASARFWRLKAAQILNAEQHTYGTQTITAVHDLPAQERQTDPQLEAVSERVTGQEQQPGDVNPVERSEVVTNALVSDVEPLEPHKGESGEQGENTQSSQTGQDGQESESTSHISNVRDIRSKPVQGYTKEQLYDDPRIIAALPGRQRRTRAKIVDDAIAHGALKARAGYYSDNAVSAFVASLKQKEKQAVRG